MKRSASCACGCTEGNMVSLPAVPGQEYVQCACLECGPMPSPSAPGAALGENRCTITKTDRGYYNWLRRARHVDAGVQEMVHNWLCGDCEEHRRVEAIRAGANKRRMARSPFVSSGPDLGGTGGSSEDEVRRAADEVKRNAERAAAFRTGQEDRRRIAAFRADREEAVQDRARDAARDAERAAWFLAEREEAAEDMARTAFPDSELA